MTDLRQRKNAQTTIKDIIRGKIACGDTDFRRAYTDILKDWPRNRKQPSFETVRRYFRQFEEKSGPSSQSEATNVVPTSLDEVAESNGDRKNKRTITVQCHLWNVLTLAAQQSGIVATMLKTEVLPVLERLAKRGRELNDPELNELLALLSLAETPGNEKEHKDD